MATMVATFVGSDSWNAEVYGSLAFASRLAIAVKQRRVVTRLAYCFWRLNGHLDSFFEEIYSIFEKSSSGIEQSVDPRAIETAIDQLNHMHRVLEGVLGAAKRSQLGNNSLTAGGVRRLQKNDDRVVELAEWLSDLLRREDLEAIFSDAQTEHERGETVSLPG